MKLRRTYPLSLLFVFGITLMAQTSSSFTGHWELNISKSKFDPPPPLKSETVTNEDGKTTIKGVTGDGSAFSWSFTPEAGKAVPIEGMENSSVEEKISGHTIDHHWKMGKGVSHGHGVLSKDGKTLKYTDIGTDVQGRPLHDVYVFEKK
jgi:hypothetical protein